MSYKSGTLGSNPGGEGAVPSIHARTMYTYKYKCRDCGKIEMYKKFKKANCPCPKICECKGVMPMIKGRENIETK